MKTTLLFTALFFIGFGFAQNPYEFHVDENGRTTFVFPQNNFLSDYQHQQHRPLELNLDWSDPDFDISQNHGVDSWDPRIAVDPSGNVGIVYNDNRPNGLQKIMFRKKTGENWSSAIMVDTGGEIGQRNNHLPSIGAAPNGDLHVVYNVWAFENWRNYIGYSKYDAATDTWHDGEKISDLGGTVDHTNGHHEVYVTENNLPVVVWGYDNRVNEDTEEIYLTYFDGTTWSPDIAVSEENDGFSTGHPYVRSIGNQKVMILYAESTGPQTRELKYRIYDEETHDLGPIQSIAAGGIANINYVLTNTSSGSVRLLVYYKIQGTNRDKIEIYEYDVAADSFEASSHSLELTTNAGGLMLRMDMDCNASDDCAIVYTNFLEESVSYLPLNQDGGFGEPLVLVEQEMSIDPPFTAFDADGNLHLTWADLRFSSGGPWNERDIFYKQGKNEELGITDFSTSKISVFPNPAKETVTISSSESYQMSIYDLTGRFIHSQEISGVQTVDLSLPTGIYLLKFINENEIKTTKLVVK